MSMEKPTLDVVLDTVIAADPRYARGAYLFLREGLDFTQQRIAKGERGGALRHISGQELLLGLRDHALDQFGPMALMVLNEWGVRRCEDFGEVVFNMVDHELLAKTETDSREDFKGCYDFDDVFRKPFLPALTKASLPPRPPRADARVRIQMPSKPKSEDKN